MGKLKHAPLLARYWSASPGPARMSPNTAEPQTFRKNVLELVSGPELPLTNLMQYPLRDAEKGEQSSEATGWACSSVFRMWAAPEPVG